tara:strand:- start:587 stop:1105 length:519 start_codon:yes stop_codon:yes gene_type:complete
MLLKIGDGNPPNEFPLLAENGDNLMHETGKLLSITPGYGEVYTALAGLNSKSLTLNNSAIDVTTADEITPSGALWAESMNGLKALNVSGDGIFLDRAAQEGRLNAVAMGLYNTSLSVLNTGTVSSFQILVPAFGTYSGSFRVVSFDFGGETEGAVTFSVSLESDGVLEFSAV